MDKQSIKNLLLKMTNPGRVNIAYFENDYACVISAENLNDTHGWYHFNSRAFEEGLNALGYNWCYLFETIPGQVPFIYLFFGEQVTKSFVINETKSMKATLPSGHELHYIDAEFTSINYAAYDNSVSTLEQLLRMKASDVFEVFEA